MPLIPQIKTPDFATARYNMIECQLRPNTVRDERVLGAMETLPRELFVPPQMAGIAYIDEDLEVAPGRYVLEPMILARLIQAAQVGADDRVLDIAPATGYSTALLAGIAKEVIAVEQDAALQKQAVQNLTTLGSENVEVVLSPLRDGAKIRGPYDVILINGAVDMVPDTLWEQLAEGGRLVVVVRRYGPAAAAHTGEARLYEKLRGTVSGRALFDANVKLLPGFESVKSFHFG